LISLLNDRNTYCTFDHSTHYCSVLEMTQAKITVGILALQGAFMEHKFHLQKAIRHASPGSPLDSTKFEIIEVRTPEQLASADALVIPGVCLL
jgi:hypothetical protein